LAWVLAVTLWSAGVVGAGCSSFQGSVVGACRASSSTEGKGSLANGSLIRVSPSRSGGIEVLLVLVIVGVFGLAELVGVPVCDLLGLAVRAESLIAPEQPSGEFLHQTPVLSITA